MRLSFLLFSPAFVPTNFVTECLHKVGIVMEIVRNH